MSETLPSGYLACVACGVVTPDDGREHVPVGPEKNAWVNGRIVFTQAQMVRCDACTAVRERAGELMDEHPELVTAIGYRGLAVYRLELALNLIDALDVQAPPLTTREDVRLVLAHLTVPGGGVRWLTPDEATPARWAHLTDDVRRTGRDALAALLRARVEQPVPCPPPSSAGLRGCLFCGVGTVEALPTRARLVWRSMRSVRPDALGGRGPDRLDGWLCPSCVTAVETVGAVGPTAMEAALCAFLGVRRAASVEVTGLVGWGVLPPGTEPNTEPWQHLALASIRQELVIAAATG